MSARRQRQPWSMKWVFIVILLVIVPYTFIRWHYRKPSRAFEPYADMKDRANTMRLLSAGFQRISLDASRPADPLRIATPAAITSAPGGVPAMLTNSLVDPPLLPADIGTVAAASSTNAMFAYSIDLACTLPNHQRQLAGAHLYVREDEAILIPLFEKLDGELLARSRETLIRLTVPPGALKPGVYRVTAVGDRSSKSWLLEVR